MLVIRFFRTGKKNQPFFKIVVTEKNRPPRGGRFVEELGFYNPLTKEKNVNKERVKYWLSVGAKPSDTVHNLLIKEGILEGKKIVVHKKKKEKKGKEEAAPVGAPAGIEPKKEAPAVGVEKPAEAKPVAEAEKPAEIKEEEKSEEPKKEPSVAKAMEGEEKPLTGLDK